MRKRVKRRWGCVWAAVRAPRIPDNADRLTIWVDVPHELLYTAQYEELGDVVGANFDRAARRAVKARWGNGEAA